ncbi:MAG TPA: cupin domain-containing protein, partial [Polyangiaceae bacterium]|nr:cupin domain-containing protein [Polyangiaceae bacterium]
PRHIHLAEVVLPCAELDETLAFFVERLGFRVQAISPADDPRAAVVAGYGVRLRLQRDAPGPAGVLRLICRDVAGVAGGATRLTAPNGTRIELVDADPPVALPPLRPSFVLSRGGGDGNWKAGRAGMLYRDLVPGRQGGRFIASLIRIVEGGPVPDYVHFHKVRFQIIFCRRGWARLVYEDQGSPFLLREGDCVLQPPTIRHRVLESAPGTEVIEIGCPAEHETLADHETPLPTPTPPNPGRSFGGQRFVRHEASAALWRPWRRAGFEFRDTGIAAATDGLAGVVVARRRPEAPAAEAGAARPDAEAGRAEAPAAEAGASRPDAEAGRAEALCHDAELLFTFVLAGAASLRCAGQGEYRVEAGDSFVVPAGTPFALEAPSDDLELLEVALPAAFGDRAPAS